MNKNFLIECPECRRINEASASFFARKKINCQCGNVLNVKTEKMRTKQCSNCGNLIVYDRGLTDDPICPVCKEHLIKERDEYKFVDIVCPECSCHITTDKNNGFINCPLCDAAIDVNARLIEQEYKSKEQPQILKCEVPSDICVWKHNSEDFALGSQIIVNESQTAIFIQNGKLVGKFDAGKHMVTLNHLVLDKSNYDIDEASFHSQLFFISKVIQTNHKWGTDSKIRMFDPLSGLHIELGAYGTYNFKITDYVKFLIFIIGLNGLPSDGMKSIDVSLKFRPKIIGIVKSELGKSIKDKDINILEVDLHTKEISDLLFKKINEQIVSFGVELTDFIVSNIVTPDDDPNFKKMKEQYAERYLKVQEERIKQAEALAAHDRIMTEVGTETDVEIARARAKAEAHRIIASAEADEMKMKGYTYQDETKRMVSTEMSSGIASAKDSYYGSKNGISDLAEEAVKAGMIKQIGKEITNDLIDVMSEKKTNQNNENGNIKQIDKLSDCLWNCPNCGTQNIQSKFCPECGYKKLDEEVWDCPNCGAKRLKSKFCPECGTKRM